MAMGDTLKSGVTETVVATRRSARQGRVLCGPGELEGKCRPLSKARKVELVGGRWGAGRAKEQHPRWVGRGRSA